MIDFTVLIPTPEGVPQMKKMKAVVVPNRGDVFLGMVKGIGHHEVARICYVFERDNAPLGIQVELVSSQRQ